MSAARERRVFSAAAWSFGDADGAWERGMLGTRSWGGEEVSESSTWDLASVTKPIVAVAVMSLVDTGELTLDDTIAEHLPHYAGTDKAGITVRHLLTHTSGIPGQVPLFRDNPTRAALLDAVRELPLIGPLGAQVAYSSQGFILLGLIAEHASGLALDVLVRQRVLEPAGMRSTGFGLPGRPQADAVATENDPWRGRVVQGEVHDENAAVLGEPAGHAGLFAPLADVEALARALCAAAGGDTALLSAAGFRTMIRPRTDHLPLRRTLGWQGVDAEDSPAGDLIGPDGFGHTGFTGTSLWVDPETARYAVLLTNRVHPSREGTGISRVRRQFGNLAFAAASTAPSAAPAAPAAAASTAASAAVSTPTHEGVS